MIIALFTTFFITLCLTVLVGIFVGAQALLSEASIRDAVADADHAINVGQAYNARMRALGAQYGIGSAYFDDVVSQQTVSSDIRSTMDAIFDHRSSVVVTGGLAAVVEERLMDFVNVEGLTRTNEIQAGMVELVEAITSDYVDAVTIPYLAEYVDMTGRLRQPLFASGVLFSSIIAFSVYFLYRLLPRLGFIRRVVQATLACAWTFLLIPSWLYIDGFYDRIRVQPYAFNRLVASFLKAGLERLILAGIALMLVSMTIHVLYSRMDRFKKPRGVSVV